MGHIFKYHNPLKLELQLNKRFKHKFGAIYSIILLQSQHPSTLGQRPPVEALFDKQATDQMDPLLVSSVSIVKTQASASSLNSENKPSTYIYIYTHIYIYICGHKVV